jgi:prolyl-tRNA synthetase
MFHEPERKDFRQIRFLRYPLHVQHGDCYPLPMSTTITPRAKNFPQWYQDVIAKTPDLVDDAPVTGAITFGPLAVKMWENIRGSFDKAIKTLGVENIMVPGLIPEHFFQCEKEHD